MRIVSRHAFACDCLRPATTVSLPPTLAHFGLKWLHESWSYFQACGVDNYEVSIFHTAH